MVSARWCIVSFLIAVYLDNLLCELSFSGIGCYWRWMFAGVFCFAGDIVLLAPCASALRGMLAICTSFASSHGLLFNTGKTQLILFRKNASKLPNDVINFNGNTLHTPNMSNILVIYCLSTLMIKKIYLEQQRNISIQLMIMIYVLQIL